MDSIHSDSSSLDDLFDDLPRQTSRVKRTYSGRHATLTNSTGLVSPPPSSSPVASPILRPIDASSQKVSLAKRSPTTLDSAKRSSRILFGTSVKKSKGSEARVNVRAKRSKTTDSSDSKKKMVQMHLNLLPAHVTCKQCGMSYTRTLPDDVTLHTAFHQSHMHGILLPLSLSSTTTSLSTTKGVLRRLTYANRSDTHTIDKCVELVDAELSAPTARKNSNLLQLYCRVSNNRITSFVLAHPLDTAFPVSDNGEMITSRPTRTILGISRMWTAKATRGQGHIRLVLDYMLQHAIVGYHVKKSEVAFTQLSGSGQIVVQKWIGQQDNQLLVYND